MERDQLLERVLSLSEENDWAGAAALLVEHLDEHEEDPAVQCWLGVAERELGMEGVAYERFKRALALEPVDPHVLATAGNALAAFDDPDAERALRTAALTAPGVALTRFLYGAYLAREGLFAEARAELEAAVELDPDDAQIRYELGVLHALAGRYEHAADALADATRLDPDEGWARVVFGLVLLETDRAEEATGELVEGARLREEDVDAQLAAALAAASTGRDGLAFEMLERARMRAGDGDIALVTAVEERVDSGEEAARAMLEDDLAPGLLRSRLSERP